MRLGGEMRGCRPAARTASPAFIENALYRSKLLLYNNVVERFARTSRRHGQTPAIRKKQFEIEGGFA